MKQFYLFVLAFISLSAFAQEAEQPKPVTLKWKGFIKNEAYYNTRQVVAARDGQFYLYPTNEAPDANGKDANESGNFNMIAIQSRLTLSITGPDALGAKTSGTVEGAFFGTTNEDVNGFRLRHAVAKLDWDKSQFLFGQTWHPMFITECFPGTVAFNTGVPFTPFARNPQLKFTYKLSSLNLFAAAITQRDFKSQGVTAPLVNSGMPELQFGAKYKTEKIVAGIGGGFKTLRPQLTTNGVVDESTISSYSVTAYLKAALKPVTVKFQGTYGTNMNDVMMLGGYDISSIDANNNTVSYTAYKTMGAWLDVHTNGKKLQAGLFAGLTQNLGAEDEITGSLGARGANIAQLMRVSPRLIYNVAKVRFALEPDVTIADYGTVGEKGVVEDTKSVSNVRLLAAFYYFF